MITLEWTAEGVRMVDQRRLPVEELYPVYTTYEGVAEAIREMVVRGAPAIGVAAAMGIALGVQNPPASSLDALDKQFELVCQVIGATRPTAVNLFWAIERMKRVYTEARRDGKTIADIEERIIREAQDMHAEDIEINRMMGKNGADLIPDGATVLTHCNAGALATAGYGTALGVIRAAVEQVRPELKDVVEIECRRERCGDVASHAREAARRALDLFGHRALRACQRLLKRARRVVDLTERRSPLARRLLRVGLRR